MSVAKRFSRPAADDIAGIVDDLSRRAPEYAVVFAPRVLTAFKAIEQPTAAAIVPEYGRPHVREIFVDRYRVMFRIVGTDVIELFAVVHSARLLRNAIPERRP